MIDPFAKYVYETKRHWKHRERDGVIAAILDTEDWPRLRNPLEHYDPVLPGRKGGFLRPDCSPMVSRKPKGLISRAGWVHLFSREFCDFLWENGAEFETGPVLYKGKELPDWFRIFPRHAVNLIDPLCYVEPFISKDCQIEYIARSELVSVARRPLESCVFGLENKTYGVLGLEQNYVINYEIMIKMLETRRKGHNYLLPIFHADGPVGKLFYEMNTPEARAARKAEIEAAEEDEDFDEYYEFDPMDTPALATLKGRRYSFELVESGSYSGGADCDEYEFDRMLCDTGKLPKEAWKAPVASWILARICAEAGEGFTTPGEQVVDGGACVLEFLVRDRSGKIIAGFDFQGKTSRTLLLGGCRKKASPAAIFEDLAGVLTKSPGKLAKCRVQVYNPEWKEYPDDYEPRPKRTTRDEFGWDGEKFLGANNVWQASYAEYEIPDRYEDYLRAVYQEWKSERKKK